MRVAQDHRSPGADVVDVAIAIDVVQIGPFAALEKDRLAPHAAKGPGRAVHAAGHKLLCTGKRGLALLVIHRKQSGSVRDEALELAQRLVHDYVSQPAICLAQYVRMMSAPARCMAVSDSITALRSSIHPRAAAALTMLYSPDTL